MATSTRLLTLEEFERLYAHQDTAYEYWFGEAVPKPMPSSVHGITQGIVFTILREAGYYTGTEVDLHISRDWRPRPDIVVSTDKLERPYPTRPVSFIVEILSADEDPQMVREKCRNYEKIGQHRIYYLDPETRTGSIWDEAQQDFVKVDGLPRRDGSLLALTEVWERLDGEI